MFLDTNRIRNNCWWKPWVWVSSFQVLDIVIFFNFLQCIDKAKNSTTIIFDDLPYCSPPQNDSNDFHSFNPSSVILWPFLIIIENQANFKISGGCRSAENVFLNWFTLKLPDNDKNQKRNVANSEVSTSLLMAQFIFTSQLQFFNIPRTCSLKRLEASSRKHF